MNNFTLTNNQLENFQKFRNDHYHEGVDSTIGGKFSFIFTPTGLGNIVEVQCNICKEKKDMTEYEYW
jgi:hypothetical protein